MNLAKLNNGKEIPKLGIGTFMLNPDQAEDAVYNALKNGYRLIDTAQSYFNEEEVGEGIQKAITDELAKREEIFITSKVWIDNYGYEKCKESVLESIRKLKVDYIDLMLLHQPFADYYGAYRALEDLYEEGKLKAIGVSNFYPDRLADICLFERKIVPHVNQVETNVFNAQYEAQENMKNFNVQIEAWAPFAEGKNNMFSNEVLSEIGKKYNKSVAQVILRWLTQRDVVALSKSTQIERVKENFNIFDFKLSEEDMAKIKSKKLKKVIYVIYTIFVLLITIYFIYTLTHSFQWMYAFGNRNW